MLLAKQKYMLYEMRDCNTDARVFWNVVRALASIYLSLIN